MATIDITRSHTLGLETAKLKAEELAKGLEDKIGIKWQWSGNDITFDAPSGAAKGTTGRVKVEATAIHVAIDLPFLLKAIKGSIASKVNEKLDALIA